MSKLEILISKNRERRQSLEKALETIYPIREKLRNELLKTQNEELLDKIVALNKIIENAETVVDMTSEETLDWYAEKYPEYVNADKSINDRGIKRFNFINKKWKKLGYLK